MLAFKNKSSADANQLKIRNFLSRAGEVILDKDKELRLALCCLLARGHLLIEDIPGMGKTTLIKTFAKLLGLQFNRIQFTNDLLPSDILGVSIYDDVQKKFQFIRGPIFSQLVLGDELNRATPKTQSACLQAMEEGQISVDGVTYQLPLPFFFAATQNSQESTGTFSLPDSQMDRFMMRISLGSPSRDAHRELLSSVARSQLLQDLPACMTSTEITDLQTECDKVHVSGPVLEYILDISEAAQKLATGFSTRASLKLLAAARGWAYISGRDFVTPDDVQSVSGPVLNHRLHAHNGDHVSGDSLVGSVLKSVTVR